MKSAQVISSIMALGVSWMVLAQNSVVRSSAFLERDRLDDSSKAVIKGVVVDQQSVMAAEGKMVSNAESKVTNASLSNHDALPSSSAASASPSDVADGSIPPVVVSHGAYRFYPQTNAVDYDLRKGLLKPQVVELLMHHRLIDSTDDIQWQASDNFMWPNSYTLSGASLDHVINAILTPYKLIAEFKGNGSVIIKKR